MNFIRQCAYSRRKIDIIMRTCYIRKIVNVILWCLRHDFLFGIAVYVNEHIFPAYIVFNGIIRSKHCKHHTALNRYTFFTLKIANQLNIHALSPIYSIICTKSKSAFLLAQNSVPTLSPLIIAAILSRLSAFVITISAPEYVAGGGGFSHIKQLIIDFPYLSDKFGAAV